MFFVIILRFVLITADFARKIRVIAKLARLEGFLITKSEN